MEDGVPGGKSLGGLGGDVRVNDGRDQDGIPPSGLQDRLDGMGPLTGARVERRLRVLTVFGEYVVCSDVDVLSAGCCSRTELLGSLLKGKCGEGFKRGEALRRLLLPKVGYDQARES